MASFWRVLLTAPSRMNSESFTGFLIIFHLCCPLRFCPLWVRLRVLQRHSYSLKHVNQWQKNQWILWQRRPNLVHSYITFVSGIKCSPNLALTYPMFSEFSWESLNILFCCSFNISEYPLWVFSAFSLNLGTIRLNLFIHIAPAGQMEIILASICDCLFSKFSHIAEFQFLARVFTVIWYPRVLLHFYIVFLLSVLFKFHSRHHALLTVI